MELAGQWRREWAGTAEYGKVIEDGVTRRIARAMEVMHASGPGAKMRVMRAAYHSTSGPGIPASSYMLHSSRRVISSGFNLLESPTFPSKPLEISSVPLESSPEHNTETENYKVTEPDDTEISEPSKWRATSGGGSTRLPSEESSSTDNASIIDLDARFNHKGLHRKYSYDSENSDIHSSKRSSTRASPLLDVPIALSTLKYKSLLNNSNDWNNRRKSYSFEDTSPVNEVILQSNDTLAMESSTDSGICKSTEIVNDYTEDANRNFEREHRKHNIPISLDQWHKSKPSTFYKGSKYKSYKEHDTVLEDPLENSFTLQSKGKVSITVPITLEGDFRNSQTSDDSDKKIKKVEFCKTELHFAAESGKVNIIATDEKPPPTNDFRKRRSAFVPINDRFEKPITLFGERTEFLERNKVDEFEMKGLSESIEFDENTAATKSILKNKIPKPKPYLLGENMEFGEIRNKETRDEGFASSGVSLINKQLQTKTDTTEKSQYTFSGIYDKSFRNSLRTTNNSSAQIESSNKEKSIPSNDQTPLEKLSRSDSITKRFNVLHMSPVQKAKTRQLRESELTYFGIDNHHKNIINDKSSSIKPEYHPSGRTFEDDDFESVRLVKKYSSSAQNSEAESEDSPEYQNIRLKNNFAPIPTPRSRVKYKKVEDDVLILKPIIEQTNDFTNVSYDTRRSRSKKQDVNTSSIRSLSEPAKKRNISTIQRNDQLRSSNRRDTTSERQKNKIIDDHTTNQKTIDYRNDKTKLIKDTNDEAPLYVNINYNDNKQNTKISTSRSQKKTDNSIVCKVIKTDTDTLPKKQNSIKRGQRVQRTEKLSTPEIPSQPRHTVLAENKLEKENKTLTSDSHSYSRKPRNKSSQRPNKENKDNDITYTSTGVDKKIKPLKINSVSSKINNEVILLPKNEIDKNKECRKTKEPIVIEHGLRSKEIRNNEKAGIEKDSGTNDRRTSRRSEYVIKYDDKNGTVSSISKVRGHSASRQKNASKERHKEHSKHSNIKDKLFEKSGLRK